MSVKSKKGPEDAGKKLFVRFFKSNGRIWWIAGILSYLVPGLGQVYNGQACRGLLFYTLYSLWGSASFIISLKAIRGSYGRLVIPLVFFFLITSLAALIAIIVDAIRNASKRRGFFDAKSYNKLWIYLLAIGVSQGSDYMIRQTFGDIMVKPYKIPTSSMSPTLEAGDLLLCDKLIYSKENPQRGDVVVFEHPDHPGVDYIKRLIGLPGDSLEIREKQIFINRVPLPELYVKHIDSQILLPDVSRRDYFGPIVLPDGQYFVMGDNRDNSLDSRFWGTVDRKLILGKPILIYWSWDPSIPNWKFIKKWGSLRKGRIGMVVK